MLENETENRAIPTRATRLAKPSARSRVSNGKDLFVGGVDGRLAYARRYRDILAQLTSDIGGDPSEAQSLVIAEYATATNTLRRLLLDLGLERRMRDITPNIDTYLRKS